MLHVWLASQPIFHYCLHIVIQIQKENISTKWVSTFKCVVYLPFAATKSGVLPFLSLALMIFAPFSTNKSKSSSYPKFKEYTSNSIWQCVFFNVYTYFFSIWPASVTKSNNDFSLLSTTFIFAPLLISFLTTRVLSAEIHEIKIWKWVDKLYFDFAGVFSQLLLRTAVINGVSP